MTKFTQLPQQMSRSFGVRNTPTQLNLNISIKIFFPTKFYGDREGLNYFEIAYHMYHISNACSKL